MSLSARPDDFFQTTSSLEETNRKAAKSYNLNGDPIKLSSKILAIHPDPRGTGCVFIAESAGKVRRVDLDTNDTSQTFSGPTAPVTCICLSPDKKIVFAGCWDKTIWSWDIDTKGVKRRYMGHADFVKSVISTRLSGRDVLISGGADASIIIWDIDSGEKLRTLKGHTRGIQDLILDPIATDATNSLVSIFSAGSDREIRCWKEPPKSNEVGEAIVRHETSIYKLFFDEDGDLWTASADKTAKNLIRERNWSAETTLTHPDFVRDVIVDEIRGWVITACRDEEVRVWNRGTGELFHTFSGHYEEVTGLVLVRDMVISVSIDSTLRRWSLRPEDLKKAKLEAEDIQANKETKAPAAKQPILTAEEERELAEIMEEDEE